MKEKSLIICGPDNVKEFNKRLKERAPEFFLLAKALHKAGMIDGLGGAIIQTKPSAQEITEKSQQHAVTSEKMKVCGHCQQFKRDSVGDGTGIGGCLSCVSTRRAKYPGHDACDLFQVII